MERGGARRVWGWRNDDAIRIDFVSVVDAMTRTKLQRRARVTSDKKKKRKEDENRAAYIPPRMILLKKSGRRYLPFFIPSTLRPRFLKNQIVELVYESYLSISMGISNLFARKKNVFGI
jgi:hypothetical protein